MRTVLKLSIAKSSLASTQPFQDPSRIFEFRIACNPENNNRPEAVDVRLLNGE
jgi:hypothetical protein